MPRYVRLGSASEILPEIVSSHAYPGQDYPLGESTDYWAEDYESGEIYPPDPNKWTRRIFRRPPRVYSRFMARRMTARPKWFMSSVAPPTGGLGGDGAGGSWSGALFIDTDGRRVQDGDDF